MGVQTFATERNSQVEFFVHFILEEFFGSQQAAGKLKDIEISSQKSYMSEIASDVWDHFLSAVQANGRPIEIWCQTTCYKGNGTGKPEPNKTYEVRETLVEGLSIRQHFNKEKDKDCRSIHFTVGDSRYTYQWFLDLKSAVYDKSLYIGKPDHDIFADIASALNGALTEQQKAAALRALPATSELARQIAQAKTALDHWWNTESFAESQLASKQWDLIETELKGAAGNWPDLSKVQGQDIKGRTNSAIFAEEMDTSDPLIPKTAFRLLSRKPFLANAVQVLGDWDAFCKKISNMLPASNRLEEFLVALWSSPSPERLVIRRLLLRIHSAESIAYVQDRDVDGVTEHTIYSGDHTAGQTAEICAQIAESLSGDNIRAAKELLEVIRARGKKLVNQARWFEARNGTELKPSFEYVVLALTQAGYKVESPASAGLRAIGYHDEISAKTVRPYTNLKVVKDQTGKKVLCVIKAKFFRSQEFPRRCKEEAFVGITLKNTYSDGVFKKRLDVPLVMFIDMESDTVPPEYAVKRLISFGWSVVFSSEELLEFLRLREAK